MNYYIINLIGLLLDITGVVGLFLLRDKGLNTIKPISINNQVTGLDIGPNFMNNIDVKIKKSIDDLNQNIIQTNETNKRILRKSLKWLLLIILGFLLQFLSVVFQFQEHLHQANDMSCTKQIPANTEIRTNKK